MAINAFRLINQLGQSGQDKKLKWHERSQIRDATKRATRTQLQNTVQTRLGVIAVGQKDSLD